MLYEMAQKQAVASLSLDALCKVNSYGIKPPFDLLFDWIDISEQIRQQNQILNQRCKDITLFWLKAGYKSYILKGQGNAMMYQNPECRTPGDIDIWVFGNRRDITRIVKDRTPNVYEQYHHIDFPIFENVTVEVHFIPGSLLIPKYNKRFYEWCRIQKGILKNSNNETEYGFYIPSIEFNAVFQMVHIYSHFFIEGIGLKHFVDYFYVLKKLDDKKKIETIEQLRWLGLEKFSRGVIWIEKECLALNDDCWLFDPDEQIGELIKKEMEKGGNFGYYNSTFSIRRKCLLVRSIADTIRLITLARLFPLDSFWKVMEKIANQRWKLKFIKDEIFNCCCSPRR